MDQFKGTPGPWIVSGVRMIQAPKLGSDTRLLSVGPDGDQLAMVFFDMKTGRGQTDARLIAAAPELLMAVQDLLKLHIAHHNNPIHAAARAAIAKATGAA